MWPIHFFTPYAGGNEDTPSDFEPLLTEEFHQQVKIICLAFVVFSQTNYAIRGVSTPSATTINKQTNKQTTTFKEFSYD